MFESSSTIEAQQLSPDVRLKQIIEKLKSLSDEIQAAVCNEENEELKEQKLEKIRKQKGSEIFAYLEEMRPLVEYQNGNLSPEEKEQIAAYLFSITGFKKTETDTSHYIVHLIIHFRTRLEKIAEKAQETPENLLEGEFL